MQCQRVKKEEEVYQTGVFFIRVSRCFEAENSDLSLYIILSFFIVKNTSS